ncbi:unnamed protein product [Pleuronectes platessa]|uniref:Uncharacterized protein n=1 Tax=Pleuronectes platessa TaxID=8262 RepID=A0A9N7VWJ5_PLEPL|nr:unnamed protein product [Pleuronectes platessa]
MKSSTERRRRRSRGREEEEEEEESWKGEVRPQSVPSPSCSAPPGDQTTETCPVGLRAAAVKLTLTSWTFIVASVSDLMTSWSKDKVLLSHTHLKNTWFCRFSTLLTVSEGEDGSNTTFRER